jgi:hypothetical protein
MTTNCAKIISGALVIAAFAPVMYSIIGGSSDQAPSVLETVHTINQVVKAAPLVVDSLKQYQKEERAREANARQDLSLTPYRVTPDSFGVSVFWQIENKSDREYRTAAWDCTAFFNSEPVKTSMVLEHHIQANHMTYVEVGFSYHDYDRSSERIDPSAFRFECKMLLGLTYPDESK